MTEQRTTALIVGAGPIGIELAIAMKQRNISYLQIDAGSVGATMAWYPQQMLFHSTADRLAIAGYYPELNPLLPLGYHDKTSGTPAAKSIPVRVVA